MLSLRRWEKEGTTDNPAEFCVSEKWYSRMVEAFNAYYKATLEKTPADKHSPAKEAVFGKAPTAATHGRTSRAMRVCRKASLVKSVYRFHL